MILGERATGFFRRRMAKHPIHRADHAHVAGLDRSGPTGLPARVAHLVHSAVVADLTDQIACRRRTRTENRSVRIRYLEVYVNHVEVMLNDQGGHVAGEDRIAA